MRVVFRRVVREVSRAAYYEWHQQQPSPRAQEDRELTEKARAIFERSRQTYGAPRVHQELQRQDVRCSRKRVARIMGEQGLAVGYPKRWKKTTIPDPDPDPPAVDLIGRRFQPEDLALNACWAGDITYVRTWEGWMYLATVIDLASRRVVGSAMADHMRADLICEALEMALSWRPTGCRADLPLGPRQPVHLAAVPGAAGRVWGHPEPVAAGAGTTR